MIPRILFINSIHQNCGVYQYGKRLYTIIKKSPIYLYDYKEIGTLKEYQDCIRNHQYSVIVYNYHTSTMTWLSRDTIQHIVKNIGIPHESPTDLWDFTINIEPLTDQYNSIPRPIYEIDKSTLKQYTPTLTEVQDFIDYGQNQNKIIIGSFGFGFAFKGFDKIIKYVNEQYDEAIIKLLITHAHYGPDSIELDVATLCQQINCKNKIEVRISHVFFSDMDLLKFLSTNTINLFIYDRLEGRSISSVIDLAISAGQPIGLSDSVMFRHVYSDQICVYKTSIQQCINNSKHVVECFNQKWSNLNLIDKMDQIVGSLID